MKKDNMLTRNYPSTPPKSMLEPLLLTLIIATAAALRFYKLGDWSFWGDEIITVRRAMGAPARSLSGQNISLLLEYLVLSTLGIREWTARLAPALTGVITIGLIYLPIRRIFGIRVALISILLLALSPWHLYWSQNARQYRN